MNIDMVMIWMIIFKVQWINKSKDDSKMICQFGVKSKPGTL